MVGMVGRYNRQIRNVRQLYQQLDPIKAQASTCLVSQGSIFRRQVLGKFKKVQLEDRVYGNIRKYSWKIGETDIVGRQSLKVVYALVCEVNKWQKRVSLLYYTLVEKQITLKFLFAVNDSVSNTRSEPTEFPLIRYHKQ